MANEHAVTHQQGNTDSNNASLSLLMAKDPSWKQVPPQQLPVISSVDANEMATLKDSLVALFPFLKSLLN